jgi:DNA invertase Pin-like site-specific DNA recombinase
VSTAESGVGSGDREWDAAKIAALIAVSGNPRARRASRSGIARLRYANAGAIRNAGELTAEEYLEIIRVVPKKADVPKPTGPQKAYGYARVSTEEQAEEGLGIPSQVRKIKEYCAYMKFTLRGIYVDEGVSGTVPLSERPHGRELCLQVRNGEHVVMARHDRGFRETVDTIVRTQAWIDAGIVCDFANWGIDTSTPFWKVTAAMIGTMAEWDREQIILRIIASQNERRCKGERYSLNPPWRCKFVWIKGRTRSGKQRQRIVVDDAWMDQVRLIVKWREVDHMTFTDIARTFIYRKERPQSCHARDWSEFLLRDWYVRYKDFQMMFAQRANMAAS